MCHSMTSLADGGPLPGFTSFCDIPIGRIDYGNVPIQPTLPRVVVMVTVAAANPRRARPEIIGHAQQLKAKEGKQMRCGSNLPGIA
jgi:hypothetical protein